MIYFFVFTSPSWLDIFNTWQKWNENWLPVWSSIEPMYLQYWFWIVYTFYYQFLFRYFHSRYFPIFSNLFYLAWFLQIFICWPIYHNFQSDLTNIDFYSLIPSGLILENILNFETFLNFLRWNEFRMSKNNFRFGNIVGKSF